jgi:hypothetical protein
MFEGFPGSFQQQPMLRIERRRLALVDAEELGIEAGDVVEEGAPLGDRPAVHAGFGIVVVVGVPAVRWHLRNQVIAAHQRIPQPLGRIDAPRESARHSDHRNRRDLCRAIIDGVENHCAPNRTNS